MNTDLLIRRFARGLAVLLCGVVGAGLVAPGEGSAAPAVPTISVKDGVTQPVFSAAEAVKETVWILSDMDSDGDGQRDRISARIIRPKETDAGLKVASIVKASPYWSQPDDAALRQQSAGKGGRVMTPAAGRQPKWGGWLDEYFVPRGYAALEVEIAGTGKSDGCIDIGGDADQRSVAAAVDWLNGRATASYADGTPAVASWSTGNVGMYGMSYDATLAIQQASTGIPGLKTIVPIAGISSWYDYTRAQGIGYYGSSSGVWGPRWSQDFANLVSSARAAAACKAQYRELGDNSSAGDWDYTSFFAGRNYRDKVDQVRASVFLVQGLMDDNVKPTQATPYWEQLVAHNVPRKLLLTSGGHLEPFSIIAGSNDIGRWMDHWLYGLDNSIMDEPEVTVEDMFNDRLPADVWPSPDARATSLYFGPAANGGAGSLTRSPVPGSQQFTSDTNVTKTTMMNDPGTAKDSRLAYLSPTLEADQRMSGTGRIEVTFTSATTSTPLTAVLVHYRDGDWIRPVAHGSLDTKNRNSLTTATRLVPGQQTTGTILLEPKDYVFPKGSQIGVILTGNLGEFIHPDPDAGQVDVALGASRAVLPLVGAPMPLPGCADPAWNNTAIYNTNDVVSHGDHRWRAQWWTQNQEPDPTNPWGVWVDLGAC